MSAGPLEREETPAPQRLGPRGREVVFYTAPERSTGRVELIASRSAPTVLPATANFSRTGVGPDSAFWMIYDHSTTPGTFALYRGASQWVLRDIRDAAGHVGAGSFDGTDNIYSTALLDAIARGLADRATPIPAPPALGPGDGGRLSMAWLRACLLVTYGTQDNTLSDVILPRSVTLPDLGGTAWMVATEAESVAINHAFQPRALGAIPFVLPGTSSSRGGSGGSGPSGGSKGGAVLAVLGALALVGASE